MYCRWIRLPQFPRRGVVNLKTLPPASSFDTDGGSPMGFDDGAANPKADSGSFGLCSEEWLNNSALYTPGNAQVGVCDLKRCKVIIAPGPQDHVYAARSEGIA
jgi:hypothetical protein